ncbi:hypothetical protein JKP88DRAFT_266043 [Tribonema minus]|uniref:SnoaL-like domain-containing protein n=1 Tax=Tribonema minus TaxID=303371 RepID=A0A835YGI9_9STRA|nr:hypothetical protein JKP88DRAFT_266043 [Tribonema minus]
MSSSNDAAKLNVQLPLADGPVSSNVKRLRAMYEALGRGDLETLKTFFADDIMWDGRESYGIPILATRRGPEEAAGSFPAFRAQAVMHDSSRIVKFLDGGDTVVSWAEVSLTWKATGRRFTDKYVMNVFEFNDEGKVVRFTHAMDTHGLLLATDPAVAGS